MGIIIKKIKTYRGMAELGRFGEESVSVVARPGYVFSDGVVRGHLFTLSTQTVFVLLPVLEECDCRRCKRQIRYVK